MAGAGGGGGGGGGDDSLFATFVQPFTDVAKTIVGQTKEVAIRLRTLINVTIEAIISSVNPFVSADYDKIFQAEAADLDKIKSQYKEVYDRTDKALNNDDFAWATLISAPKAVLTGKFLETAPRVVGGLAKLFIGDKIEGAKGSINKFFFSSVDTVGGSKYRFGENRRRSNYLLLEKEEEKNNKKDNDDEKKKVIEMRKKIINQAIQTPEMQKMKKESQQILEKNLKDFFETTEKWIGIKDINQLVKATGGKLNLNNLKDEKGQPFKKEELQKPEAKKALILSFNGSKEKIKANAISSLQDRKKKILSAGIPEDAFYIQRIDFYIDQIKNLKTF
jgi:hypothetical protein